MAASLATTAARGMRGPDRGGLSETTSLLAVTDVSAIHVFHELGRHPVPRGG